jgi:hypothetical protein
MAVIVLGFLPAAQLSLAQTTVAAAAPQSTSISPQCPAVHRGRHENSRLPQNTTISAGISFATAWGDVATGGWYGRQAMDDCRIHPDGVLTWHGKTAVRVEVQPGDDPLDLHANSERAEMLVMQDASRREIRESSASGAQYYATSYFLPEGWRGQQLPWSAFAPIDCSAGAQTACNSWSYIWQFYGWGGMTAGQRTLNGPQQYAFNNTTLRDGGLIDLGKWTDFVFLVDWNSGTYTVWRRDEGQDKFHEALTGRSPVQGSRSIYVKQGLYRGGHNGGRTDVLWIGPTARGSSFASVEQQAFGTARGVE